MSNIVLFSLLVPLIYFRKLNKIMLHNVCPIRKKWNANILILKFQFDLSFILAFQDKNIFEHGYFSFVWQMASFVPSTLPKPSQQCIQPNNTTEGEQSNTANLSHNNPTDGSSDSSTSATGNSTNMSPAPSSTTAAQQKSSSSSPESSSTKLSTRKDCSVVLMVSKLSSSFVLETLIHAKEKSTILQWIEHVTKQFNACHEAGEVGWCNY